jgi:hypothetical protein
MHLQRNTEAHSYKSCCNGKATSTAYSECVNVALGIENAMRMHHIFICGLPTSTTFFFSHGAIFGEGGGEFLNTKCVF